MIIRLLLLLLLFSAARAETQSQNEDTRTRAPERRPASSSIPQFDHSPGAQPSVPATNSIPDNSVERPRR